MGKYLLAAVFLLGWQQAAAPAKPAAPAAAVDIIGTWRCQLDFQGTPIAVGLHIAKGDAGALTASLDDVMGGGAPLDASATYKEGALHVDVPSIPSSFDGKLNAAGDAIEGSWAAQGSSFACNLQKDSGA